MRIKPYTVTLKDGKTYTVRSATAQDGAIVNAFRRRVAGETEFLIRYPDEVPLSADGETRRLAAGQDSPRDAFLLVMNGNDPVGFMHLYAESEFEKLYHRARIGVQIAKKYQSLGAGRLLMSEGIRYAEAMGFALLVLSVSDKNERALSLYRSLGFTEYARLPDAIRLRDGTVCDEIGMYIRLNTKKE